MTVTVPEIVLFGAVCLLTGFIIGWRLARALVRPAVTDWGESTALWSEVDWHWFESGHRPRDGA